MELNILLGGGVRGPAAGPPLPVGHLVAEEAREGLLRLRAQRTTWTRAEFRVRVNRSGGAELRGGVTVVAAVHPDAVAIIPAATPHHVVAVVCLRDLVVGIDDNL